MSANDPRSDVVMRTVNLSAEIKKIWGPEWNAPEQEYEFSNGRKFTRRTGDCAMYETSPDFPL